MLQRAIPSSGEALPVIGLGTWQTFDIPPGADARFPPLTDVLQTVHRNGGMLIDSSPMYGHAEETIGRLTQHMAQRDPPLV